MLLLPSRIARTGESRVKPVDSVPPKRGTAASTAVCYPSSDGKPMAETERHAIATINAWQALRRQFADREDVYVGVDMLLYYVEGDPRKSVVPDIFVVFGVPKLPPRDNWLAWREGKLPDFVLEVTSRRTRHRDEGPKRELYQRLGVEEYWQYDPTGDYLDPRLKGARLTGPAYRPIPATIGPGGIQCASRPLGLELHLSGNALRFFDPARAEYLPTPYEDQVRANREADRANREADRANQEADRAEAALHRVAELEAELRKAQR